MDKAKAFIFQFVVSIFYGALARFSTFSKDDEIDMVEALDNAFNGHNVKDKIFKGFRPICVSGPESPLLKLPKTFHDVINVKNFSIIFRAACDPGSVKNDILKDYKEEISCITQWFNSLKPGSSPEWTGFILYIKKGDEIQTFTVLFLENRPYIRILTGDGDKTLFEW